MADRNEIRKAIDRVTEMEACFDTLLQAANHAQAFPEVQLQQLIRYYESGQWLQDYALDEEGLLPKDLKRGVLAQDAVYDFLEQIQCAK